MCSHPLNGPGVNGLMMGKDECTSPSGFYDLEIPINKTLPCTDTKMRDTNCKDLDVSFSFTSLALVARKYQVKEKELFCWLTSKFLRVALFANVANTRIVNVYEIRVENEAILRLRPRKRIFLLFSKKKNQITHRLKSYDRERTRPLPLNAPRFLKHHVRSW